MILTPKETVSEYVKKGWWSDVTVNDLFQAACDKHPNEMALIDPLNRLSMDGVAPRSLTWNALRNLTDSVATALLELGLNKDDRILVQLPNTVDAVIIFLAASKLGLIISPIVMQYREHELRHAIHKIKPRAFITIKSFNGFNHADLGKTLATENEDLDLIVLSDDPEKTSLLETTADTARLSNYAANNPINAAEILTICWTSGTESQSKGVPRCHSHWVLNAEVIIDSLEMRESDVLLNPFPLVNIGSIGGLVLPWLMLQSKLVLHHPFDIGIFLQQIQDEGVTYTIAPPAVLGALLKQPDLLKKFNISSLRAIGSGSAPLSPWLIDSWKQSYNIEITNVFGSNEGSSLFSSPKSVPDTTERARYFPRLGAKDIYWEGRTAQVLKTKLVDLATGDDITEPGKTGELRLAGATMFSGYWESPELNRKAFDEAGYYKTGDLFQIAGDGNLSRYYSFVGRSKEIIVRGGVNISPAELDDLIVGHPKISEAATVGIDDSRLGEKVAVAIVPNAGETVELSDISDWLAEKGTAIFKRPEFIVTVPSLPRNAMNKVMRDTLRETVLSLL
ncbi:class I adenylate-forming enzyme family protein [Litorimonas taeanensis]|nr:class I adenylate-forming enzyme family protein [Litorimonas taeanensis]